jgi:two-component SAPR family response regulator
MPPVLQIDHHTLDLLLLENTGVNHLLLPDKGPFLPSDIRLPWTLPSRETLKNGLLRIIIKAGQHYEQAVEWENAVEFYLKGLDTDHLAEEFYRRLMVCYRNLGKNADAVKTYNRCRGLLKGALGIEPSPETTAVYSSIMQTQ